MTWTERFIQRLHELSRDDDRAALAKLRRSLDGEVSSVAGAAQVIARGLPAKLETWEENDAYLLASLFALAPNEGGGLPLARALRNVATATESGSIELRFTTLLASAREDLGAHLRHAVTLVNASGGAVDWARLFEDLRRWGLPSGAVQKKWAREYWGSLEAPTDTTITTPEGMPS